MIVIHERIIDCSLVTPAECSDRCLVALKHGPAFTLRADSNDAKVHGSVTISHNEPPTAHTITVEVYEISDAPVVVDGRPVGRETTLARPAVMPTAQTIRGLLNAWT